MESHAALALWQHTGNTLVWSVHVGALEMRERVAFSAMKPLKHVLALNADAPLDHALIRTVLHSGYSRLPVYFDGTPSNLTHYVLTRDLLAAAYLLPAYQQAAGHSGYPALTDPEGSAHGGKRSAVAAAAAKEVVLVRDVRLWPLARWVYP